MKSLILAANLLLTATAFASPEVLLQCAVPSQEMSSGAVVAIDRASSTEADIIILMIQDPDGSQFYYQSAEEKGAFDKALAENSLDFLGIGVKFAQESGVLKDVALVNITMNELSEIYEGFVSANGNLYPLICTKVKANP